MKIKEVLTPDAAAGIEEKEYYTKEEVDALLLSLYKKLAKEYNELISEVNRSGSNLYMRMNDLVDDFKKLEASIGEMSKEVDRYLLKEKEARRRAALERLNSGAYDFEDEEED